MKNIPLAVGVLFLAAGGFLISQKQKEPSDSTYIQYKQLYDIVLMSGETYSSPDGSYSVRLDRVDVGSGYAAHISVMTSSKEKQFTINTSAVSPRVVSFQTALGTIVLNVCGTWVSVDTPHGGMTAMFNGRECPNLEG